MNYHSKPTKFDGIEQLQFTLKLKNYQSPLKTRTKPDQCDQWIFIVSNKEISMYSLAQIQAIVQDAMKKAFKVHESLGESGKDKIQKNDFGQTALRADIECEKIVIQTLKDANLPVTVISEEHGKVELSKNPEFLAILDGIDGTKEYVENRSTGRYGTMLAIFKGINPCYEDYLVSAIMHHSTSELFLAVKDKGAFCIDQNNNFTSIQCQAQESMDKNTIKIHADFEFDKNRGFTTIQDTFVAKLPSFEFLNERASCVHYIDLAKGDASLVFEVTRKRNLEIAVSFGLISEANGVMLTLDGTPLNKLKYFEFGQEMGEHLPVVSAATDKLAKELLKKIK